MHFSKHIRHAATLVPTLSLLVPYSAAYDLQPDDPSNIKSIAAEMAVDMMGFYSEIMVKDAPGDVEAPYYWWEAGALMNVLIDYWKLTGDDQYNDDIMAGLVHQTGPKYDYMPQNQTLTEGNDDQGFWGMAVLSAAELGFPEPPSPVPNWLALAQSVFNTQVARWDTAECGGGLRWQIFTWNNGYNYKNTISQGCFFNMAARLALYTGNTTYSDWAEKVWDWMIEKKFIDDSFNVFDGAYVETGCTDITPYQWTYNNGVFMLGAAALYNLTGSDTWKQRLDNMINGTNVFWRGDENNIMTEVACETVNQCNYDEQSFKAYMTRWMASVTKWAPYTAPTIKPYLRATSLAAASTCTGGDNGRLCGLKWYTKEYDTVSGLGTQMAALEAILTNLIDEQPAALTSSTGGIRQGDTSLGTSGDGIAAYNPTYYGPISQGGRVGAGFLTTFVLICLIAGMIWMLKDEHITLGEFFRGGGFGLGKEDITSLSPNRSSSVLGSVKGLFTGGSTKETVTEPPSPVLGTGTDLTVKSPEMAQTRDVV